MKKRYFLCILFAAIFSFAINVKALTKEEVVDTINNYYDEVYNESDLKDIVIHKAEFDSDKSQINFTFGFNCTGTCDGKLNGSTAERRKSEFSWLYNDEEKSIEYKNDGIVNDKNAKDQLHVLLQAAEIINKMGYDYEIVGEVFNSKDLNYNDNKIEFELVDIPDDYVTEDGAQISGAIIKNLKFSIDKLILPDNFSKEPSSEDKQEGDKFEENKLEDSKKNTEKNVKNNVANPKTGDINMNVISISMIGLCTLMFVGIKKVKKLK